MFLRRPSGLAHSFTSLFHLHTKRAIRVAKINKHRQHPVGIAYTCQMQVHFTSDFLPVNPNSKTCDRTLLNAMCPLHSPRRNSTIEPRRRRRYRGLNIIPLHLRLLPYIASWSHIAPHHKHGRRRHNLNEGKRAHAYRSAVVVASAALANSSRNGRTVESMSWTIMSS